MVKEQMNALAYIDCGNAKDELGDYNSALTDYDKSIELKPIF